MAGWLLILETALLLIDSVYPCLVLSMGMSHDDDHATCTGHSHIMSGEWVKGRNPSDLSWSSCSRDDLENFLRWNVLYTFLDELHYTVCLSFSSLLWVVVWRSIIWTWCSWKFLSMFTDVQMCSFIMSTNAFRYLSHSQSFLWRSYGTWNIKPGARDLMVADKHPLPSRSWQITGRVFKSELVATFPHWFTDSNVF